MEGVAFASMRNIDLMQSRGCHLDRIVTAAGRAKTRLGSRLRRAFMIARFWPPGEPECGVVGWAMLAARLSFFSNLESVVSELVRYGSRRTRSVALLRRRQHPA
jgi:xylulokinase